MNTMKQINVSFVDIQTRQMDAQQKETQSAHPVAAQTAFDPINQKAEGFATEIQRYLSKDLGTAYKSMVISDANKNNLVSETYFISEMSNDCVLIEVHDGPFSKTKFEFKFQGPTLFRNGESVSLEELQNFYKLLCFVLKKANEDQADIYKERV